MKHLFLFSSLFFSFILNAQQSFPCKTDEMHQDLFKNHSQYNKGILKANQQLTQDTKQFLQYGSTKSNALYVIPVVFHIIHNYGPENISDAQIHDALKQVNIQFRKKNADTTEIVPAFKNIAADVEIEFRLAQLDPSGNCTSGITRTVSPLTSPGNHDVKSLIQWPPHQYLNIYVCREAAGLAGHAMLPSAADTIPQWDGIVMIHSSVGTIGTSEYFKRTVLTHEIGHYLNLQHIWGGNNVPNYDYLVVGQPGNCAYDDEVADTPNTIGWQSCNLNGTSCGSLDNVQNYMDYAYCGRMFTEGQKARMHACLNSNVANRNNLWQEANLIATGTAGTSNILCAAKFESDKRVACVNEPIHFTDMSYHGVQNRTWFFEGGTASSYNDSSVIVTYSSPGEYRVKLIVQSENGTKEVEIEKYIIILPNESNDHFTVETFETNNYNCTIIPVDSPYKWEINEHAGYQSTKSIFFNNFDSPSGMSSQFVLDPVDVSSLSNVVVSFDYAFAQKSTTNNDLLKVFVSKNCGQTWDLRKTLIGTSSLITSPPISDHPFAPTVASEWKNVKVNIGNSNSSNQLLVKFQIETNGGNNLYVDNIQVSDQNQLSVHNSNASGIAVSPNPSSTNITIDAEDELIQMIELYNLEGRVVYLHETNNQTSFQFSIENQSKGTYILKIITQKGIYNKIQLIE